MNTLELERRLSGEGCSPALYAIGSRGMASDAFCLTFNGTQWEVYYTERGQDQPPIFASGAESQACEFFYRHIMSLRHDHCVGFFRSEDNAVLLLDKLRKLGASPFRDKVPYGGVSDPRHRVFVTGKEIFLAKELIENIPATD